ncbi:hypothetical protein B0T12DRAFT_427915 [Alternaria alternata]|nr:hypothetical protein B0T12DRAFT_427915 [Alternaria alternata]
MRRRTLLYCLYDMLTACPAHMFQSVTSSLPSFRVDSVRSSTCHDYFHWTIFIASSIQAGLLGGRSIVRMRKR